MSELGGRHQRKTFLFLFLLLLPNFDRWQDTFLNVALGSKLPTTGAFRFM